ncbi:hypothetical protein NDU88_002030 [Pleurodeles waltl]|uniref:Lamina-associated polypeptide 2 alpha C-terminal domain-containing protein n=1 Tax=Pleurodeles waltl TaxID=8319 RepID=A0AAV7TJH4_PLEWA|nr:hypothetical protein NDU88_002030 [Pleurodeles waltl]
MERSPWCADGCQSSVPVDVPIHPCIQEVIKREWRDPDKIILPRFVAKVYPLQDMAQVLPDSVTIDSSFASLIGCMSLAEDAVIWDSVDKKVDVSLKKSGTHLALRADIYGTYIAQSLLLDLKALNSALDGSSDCSGLMSLIEHQVEFLSDISFDGVRASALVEGACVSALPNLVLRDWKTDAAQLASALRLPFQVSQIHVLQSLALKFRSRESGQVRLWLRLLGLMAAAVFTALVRLWLRLLRLMAAAVFTVPWA